MSVKDKTLATFQIDKKQWNKFKRLTGNQSASAILVQFIEKFLDNPHILEQSNYGETNNIEYQSITNSRIKAFEERLSIIETYNKQSAINSEANYITNIELTEVLDRLKTLESKFSVIEKLNTESAINSAIQSIINLEVRCKELDNKLSIIENSNKQLVTNSDRESINNLEGDHPTEKINKEQLEKINDESYLKEVKVKDSEKPKMPVTDDLFLKCLEEKVKKMVDANTKDIYQATAILLNQRCILTKSKIGEWTWTKVKDYFKRSKSQSTSEYIKEFKKRQ